MKVMDPPEKVGRLYGLVKVHKPVKEGHKLPPLRPVVSGSGCITEKISEFIDLCIKEQVRKIPSFIEDSPDMLRLIQKENEKGPQDMSAFPVTVDVCGLYTNIPGDGEDGGLQAFEKALNDRSDKSIPTIFLMTLLSMVLGGNYFEFNQKIYKQLIGTAMGTRVACSYACLFMAWLESTRLLGNWKGVQPRLWRRYIDDIWFLWAGSEDELKDFIRHLNSSHRLIKFTANYNVKTKSTPFLDMEISIDNKGYLQTDLYKKDCARVQYLLPESCHPGHISRNIPYSLSYRLLRICSNRGILHQETRRT